MKKLFILFSVLFILIIGVQYAQAEEYKVLVLPDTIQFERTNYLIFPDSSTMFATDAINELKKNNKIEIVSMAEVRDALRKDVHISVLTKKAIKEFKYNYNIAFVDLRSIAHYFSTSKVLVITSQTDVQNYFLRRTIWDKLNIPGFTVIDPVYKLSTYVALIDVDKETIIWQNTYYKNIGSMESRIIAENFAPATEQLQKIKYYSLYYLAPAIASNVQEKILPPPSLEEKNVVEVSNQQKPPENITLPDEINFKPKLTKPATAPKTYGTVINAL